MIPFEDTREEPQPVIVTECSNCGQDIFEGEEYYLVDGNNYCENCMEGFRKVGEIDVD